VVEGDGLLNRYTALNRIRGSNPLLSAKDRSLRSIMKYFVSCLSLFLTLLSPAYVQGLSFQSILKKYDNTALELPTAQTDGRIQTLNRKGATSPYLDYATQAFIEFSGNKKVLEVGGAYGLVMSEVFKRFPKTTYHLNDLDGRHLYLAARYLRDQKIAPQVLKDQTLFIPGNIVDMDIKDKYDAILVARVLHFMNPEDLNKAIENMYRALRSGGRVYVVAITPYVKRYQSFIPEYHKRLKQGIEYPGYVRSLYDWIDEESTSSDQKKQISDQPFMFLDDAVLRRLLTQAGFKMIECKTQDLGYPSDAWCLDGRENVVAIAEKRD
jgi:ubiquinone/menaquinone biosynthesis C-methylase UbiE